jgi:hypothetical protein
MEPADTSAKQRIRVAYLGAMKVMEKRLTWKRYLGKDVCMTEIEVKRMGAGQERTERDEAR